MANDDRQEQETLPQGQQQPTLRSNHIRPKIQRKSPKANKTKQDKSTNHTDASPADEIEVTRKRMESWMGLRSKNGNETKSDQKTIDSGDDTKALHFHNKDKDLGSHENSESKQGKQKQPVSVLKSQAESKQSKQKQLVSILKSQAESKQNKQKQPVSILKSPKYSSKNQLARVEIKSPALASTMRVDIGGSSSTISDIVPSDHTIARTQQNQVSNAPENDDDAPGNMRPNKPVICKDIVVERDPTKSATKRKSFRRTNRSKDQNNASNYASIEGYVPASSGIGAPMKMKRDIKLEGDDNTTENESDTKVSSSINDKDDHPLVIDSLEGLMRAAGEILPENPDKITEDAKMVEADISFSVMTQDQYENNLPTMKEEQEEERKRHLEVFMGKHDILGDYDDYESIEGAVDGDGIEDDDDDDDDAVMELLLGSDINNDDENDNTSPASHSEEKAFTLLWSALTNWMTHDTVLWVRALQDNHKKESSSINDNDNNTSVKLGCNDDSKNIDTEWSPMVDRSDIGASRCAGVLAMIRLYLGKCMEELNHPLESRRKAEKRLNDILRTFDYSRENPKLTATHWKAMACILLDAVLIESREEDLSSISVPQSVANVGMSKEEFEYLSRKSVLIFE